MHYSTSWCQSQLVCWGNGQFGQHGHNSQANIDIKTAINQPISLDCNKFNTFRTNIVHVVCGASHTIAVTGDNEVFVWGNGQYGQLGCGEVERQLIPIQINLTSDCSNRIIQVACGDRHTCFLTNQGEVLGCGSNFYAQISYDLLLKQYKSDVFIPRPIRTKEKVSQVACGQHHSIFLYESGEVAAVGRNIYGQVGILVEDARHSTIEVATIIDVCSNPIVFVATGSNHSLCIDNVGKSYCWGYGKACGLREGHQMVPKQLKVLSSSHLAEPTSSELGVTQNHPGLETITEDSSQHESTTEDDCSDILHQTPSCRSLSSCTILLENGDATDLEVVTMDGGTSHTVLLTRCGSVFCLGYNHDGQCGQGTDIWFCEIPSCIPPEQFGCDEIVQISSGENYAAALSSSGTVYMWGKVISTFEPVGTPYHIPVAMVIPRCCDSDNQDVLNGQQSCSSGPPYSLSSEAVIKEVICGTWHTALIVNVPITETENSHLVNANGWSQDKDIQNNNTFDFQAEIRNIIKFDKHSHQDEIHANESCEKFHSGFDLESTKPITDFPNHENELHESTVAEEIDNLNYKSSSLNNTNTNPYTDINGNSCVGFSNDSTSAQLAPSTKARPVAHRFHPDSLTASNASRKSLSQGNKTQLTPQLRTNPANSAITRGYAQLSLGFPDPNQRTSHSQTKTRSSSIVLDSQKMDISFRNRKSSLPQRSLQMPATLNFDLLEHEKQRYRTASAAGQRQPSGSQSRAK